MIDLHHSPLLCDIAGHALSSPDKVALVAGPCRVTYGQLVAHIERSASHLQALGIQPGDRILLAAEKEVEFVYLYLASHLIGAVNVVVDATAPRERLQYIVGVTHPVLLFGADLPDCGAPVISYDRFGSESGGDCLPLQLPDISADDVADVMFTTGTTAAPKGVCLTHANVAGSAANTNAFIGTSFNDIEALALPLSHSFGLGRMRCVLSVGATLVLVNNFANLKSFFSLLESEHVTGFGMVPAVWQYIKRLSGNRISKYADQMRYIEIGSAAMSVDDKTLLMQLFPNTRLCMHYGLTEASRAMFTEFHAQAANLQSVGKPASSLVEACVLDEEGNPMADGVDGEICVRGNMVTRSYFLSSDNEGAFHGDWFRTGDWGHRDSDGYYYLTGRKKELINVGGEKVSPASIENAIKSLGVTDCACVAILDPRGVLGEVPKAFLLRGSTTLTIDEIKQHLASLLPPHEMPAQWEWIDQIPRTPSGKIQRLKLKQ